MNHKTRVYENVFEMLPNEENPTPLVRLNKLNRCAEFPLYAQLEWMNPFGSVKDRAAWELLRELEERGQLANRRGIVEPTSGNTGISMVAMARARGHRLLAMVPDKVPLVRAEVYLLGLPNVKSYDGSWTEYGSIVGAPIEK